VQHSAFIIDLSITNVTSEVRQVTPWLHNHFHGWVDHGFVVQDGEETPYLWHDVYWDGHRVGGAKSMRLVASDAPGRRFAVLVKKNYFHCCMHGRCPKKSCAA
jgi:hypothetical protein